MIDWKFQTLHYAISPEDETHYREKLEALNKYFQHEEAKGEVHFRTDQHEQKHQFYDVQITLRVGQNFMKAEKRSEDMRSSFHAAWEVIKEEARRHHEVKVGK